MRNYGQWDGRTIIVVNNVTNNYGMPSVREGRYAHHGKRRDSSGTRKERQPELLRYCRSCGILDQRKVMNMSNGQIAEGAVEVLQYSINDLGQCAKASFKGGEKMMHGLMQIGRGLFDLGALILK